MRRYEKGRKVATRENGARAKAKPAKPVRCICAIPGESDMCPACYPGHKAQRVRVPIAPAKPIDHSKNPWIDRRHFDVVLQRAIAAENMCKDLIRVIAIDDGEFLASHGNDYLAAGDAIKRGDV